MSFILTGLFIIVAIISTILVAVLVSLGGFSWFGRLPADIRYRGGYTRVSVPVTSMLLVSLVLSLALYLMSGLF